MNIEITRENLEDLCRLHRAETLANGIKDAFTKMHHFTSISDRVLHAWCKSLMPDLQPDLELPYPEAGCAPGARFVARWARPAEKKSVCLDGVLYIIQEFLHVGSGCGPSQSFTISEKTGDNVYQLTEEVGWVGR